MKNKLHPLILIRRELAKDPAWEKYSTHAGFAQLVGRSRSWVKNNEYGFATTSTAFAQRVSDRLGIDPAWLLAPLPAAGPIPAAGGGEWHTSLIPARLKSALDANLQTLEKKLANPRENKQTHSSSNSAATLTRLTSLPENQQFLADVLSRHVRDQLIEEFHKGNPETFITNLRQLLQKSDANEQLLEQESS